MIPQGICWGHNWRNRESDRRNLMSDDTPTQKFDAAGDAPTERMTQADSDSGEAPAGRSRRTLIILASIGGALLLAVLILLVVLLSRGSGEPVALPTNTESESATPSASPTPSESASPSPTPTETEEAPPPPTEPAGPTINSFTTANDEVICNTQAPNPSAQYITFSWSTSDVSEVYFGVNTNDASQGAFFDNLPPSGDTTDFPPGYYPFEYPCPSASTKYTLTVVDSDGLKASKSIVITNVGDTQ